MTKQQQIIDFVQEEFGITIKKAREFNLNSCYGNYIIIEVKTGESSGGSCWGGETAKIYIDDEDKISDLKYNLESKLNTIYDLLDLDISSLESDNETLARDTINNDNYIYQHTDYYDYYGNYSENTYYNVDVLKFLENKLSNKKMNELKKIVENHDNALVRQLNIEISDDNIKNIVININDFEKNMNEELKNLKLQKSSLQKQLKSTITLINNFSEYKKSKLEDLQSSLNSNRKNNHKLKIK